jgi:uncharacterized membrane protein
MKNDPLQRIHRLKAMLLALVSLLLGIGLLALARLVDASASLTWLAYWPVSEIGGTLAAAGIFGIAWDYVDGRDKEVREDERVRRLLKESAPYFRDAVVQGFAVDTADLQRVATPELLDQIATNVLSLRLGDPQFAEEVYREVRDQAIRAPERWYDVEVKVRLSPIGEKSTSGALLFDVTVEWQYSTVPSHAVRKFACVSDREEYRDLASDVPATSTWFMAPRPGLDASQRESFELLFFGVDGDEQKIRRQQRKGGQTYSVRMSEDVVRDGQSVRIKHIYRTRTTQAGHFLFLEMPQPARGLSLTVDYESAPIAQLRVTDLLTSARRTQIVRKPDITGEKSVSVDHAGWVLPRAGVAIAWTLLSEEAPTSAAAAKRAA